MWVQQWGARSHTQEHKYTHTYSHRNTYTVPNSAAVITQSNYFFTFFSLSLSLSLTHVGLTILIKKTTL